MRSVYILYILLMTASLDLGAQVWTPLDGGLTNTPTAITSAEKLIATAEFLGREKEHNVHQISIWNGYYWLKLPKIYADTFSIITQLKFYKQGLYIAGRLNSIEGLPNAKHIIRWQNRKYDNLSELNSKINNFNAVKGLDIYDNKLIVSGLFQTNASQYGNNISIFNGTAVLTATSQSLGSGISGTLSAVHSNEDNILVFAGRLKQANDTNAYELAYIKNNKWYRADSTNIIATHITTLNGTIVYGGYNAATKILGIFSSDSGQVDSFGQGISEITDLFDMVTVDGVIYASGVFYLDGRDESVQLIQFRNGSWSAVPNGELAGPRKLVGYRTNLVASGFFTYYSFTNYNHIALYLPDHGVLAGRIYFDKDKNCQFSSRDENLNIMNLSVNAGDYFIKPLESGFYFKILPFGEYTVNIIPQKGWNSVSCSSNSKDIKLSAQNPNGQLDFPMIQQVGLRDLSIKLSSFSGWVVDKNRRVGYSIRYANKGSENVAQTRVVLKFDSKLGDLKSTPTPDLQQGDSAVWIIQDLFAGEERSISCSFEIDQNSEDDLELSASIDLEEEEAESEDNESHLTQTLAETDYSFKKEIYLAQGDTAYINDSSGYIEYQISFSNYTSDTIKDVFVIDTIKLNHDLTIIQTTGASHPVSSEAFPGAIGEDLGIIVWTFKDINLLPNPDQNPEIVAHKGFVRFKLGLSKSLTEGTVLTNKGDVVFDFYEAEATNRVYAIVDNSTLSIHEPLYSKKIICYPNPTSTYLSLSEDIPSGSEYHISDMSGKSVMQGRYHKQMDVRSLHQGIYILQIVDGNTLYHTKFIKH